MAIPLNLISNTQKSLLLRGTTANDLMLGWGVASNGVEDSSKSLDEKFYGDFGNDTLYGGAGKDALYGESGNDSLFGGSGNDLLDGGSDNDTLNGSTGDDQLLGGSGNDSLDGGSDNDVLSGGSGDDQLLGGTGNDQLDGGSNNDILNGGSGDDRLLGGSGNDQFEGGSGADVINGGSGTDSASYTTSETAVVVNLVTNVNTGGDAAGDTLIGVENLIGSSYNDTLTGDAGANVITGGAGADILTGGSGIDTFMMAFGAIGDTITDFTAGFGGDVIEFTGVNDATEQTFGVQSTFNDDANESPWFLSGFTVVDTYFKAPASLSSASVAAFLADINNYEGQVEYVVFDEAEQVSYLAVASGGNTGIFRLAENDDLDDNGVINADEITLLVTLTGVSNASTLSTANFTFFPEAG